MRASDLLSVTQQLVNGGAKRNGTHPAWGPGASPDLLWEKVRPIAVQAWTLKGLTVERPEGCGHRSAPSINSAAAPQLRARAEVPEA